MAGFFRGLGLSCLRSFPMNGGALFVYEGIMRWLDAEKVVAAACSLTIAHTLLAGEKMTSLCCGNALGEKIFFLGSKAKAL